MNPSVWTYKRCKRVLDGRPEVQLSKNVCIHRILSEPHTYFQVHFHSQRIVVIAEDGYTLFINGWFTSTLKNLLNQMLPIHISQKHGAWGVQPAVGESAVLFEEGLGIGIAGGITCPNIYFPKAICIAKRLEKFRKVFLNRIPVGSIDGQAPFPIPGEDINPLEFLPLYLTQDVRAYQALLVRAKARYPKALLRPGCQKEVFNRMIQELTTPMVECIHRNNTALPRIQGPTRHKPLLRSPVFSFSDEDLFL